MWECDDVEHLNGPYGDGEFTVHEVPADGSDDYAWEKDVWTLLPYKCIVEKQGIFNKDKPEKMLANINLFYCSSVKKADLVAGL